MPLWPRNREKAALESVSRALQSLSARSSSRTAQWAFHASSSGPMSVSDTSVLVARPSVCMGGLGNGAFSRMSSKGNLSS